MDRQPPRLLAVEILNSVETTGAFAEPLLDQYISRQRHGDHRDRRLLTELVYGVLRRRGFLDWVLAQFLHKGIPPAETSLGNIFRTALYQVFFTDKIPPHAIVHEAVELTKNACPGRASLVNAVLRNILRRKDELSSPNIRGSFVDAAAVIHSHPAWLVKMWSHRWGEEETLALCEANNAVPSLTLRVNPLHTNREKVIEILKGEGVRTEQTLYAQEGLVVRGGEKPLRDTVPYRQGWFHVQDEASQLIARLVAPEAGETILDLCAGMGGKTTQFGEIMGNRGRIIAVELRKSKIRQMGGLAKRLGVGIIEAIAADATEPLAGIPLDSCHRVLVDVPCSGLGTLRRCPEIKWRLTPGLLNNYPGLQKKLLERAGDYVKTGGRLIYSTCSIMNEENDEVVASFLDTHRGFHVIVPEGVAPSLLDTQGYFRTFPHRQGTDGFFGAVMEKS